MKKFARILLTSLVTLSVVGCSSAPSVEPEKGNVSNDTSKETSAPVDKQDKALKGTISVQVESPWLAHYEAAVERVKATYPDVTINLIETGSFDHLDVMDSTDVTNPDVADVFALPADRIYGLAQNDVLTELDAQAMANALGGFGNYDDGLGGNFKIDGQYLAFPMNIETLITFANTANAEAKGIDLSSTIEFNDLDSEGMLIVAHNAWFGVALTNSAEIALLEKDASGNLYTDLTTDFKDLPQEKQAAFESLFNYWKGHEAKRTNLWDKDACWGYIDAEFATGGNSALRIDGPWSTNALAEAAGNGEDLAILPITQVTFDGKPLLHWKGGWGLGINARLEGKEDEMLIAQEMIKEIVNPDYAVDFFKATGKILENVDAAQYNASDLSDTDKKVIAAVLESYENAPARPLFTEWGQVWATWENSMLSWSAVKPATVEEAYEQLQAGFEAMMANF